MACDVILFSDVNGVAGVGRYGGPYRIATVLRDAGYATQVVEFFADLSIQLIERILDKYMGPQTLFVGFATTLMVGRVDGGRSVDRMTRTAINRTTGHLPQDDEFVREMFAAIRQRNPRTKIVIGGGKAHNTSLPGVDYWVWGYADLSVLALAESLRDGRPLTTHPGQYGLVVKHRDYPVHEMRGARIDWMPEDHVRHGRASTDRDRSRLHLPLCLLCASSVQKQRRIRKGSRCAPERVPAQLRPVWDQRVHVLRRHGERLPPKGAVST